MSVASTRPESLMFVELVVGPCELPGTLAPTPHDANDV